MGTIAVARPLSGPVLIVAVMVGLALLDFTSSVLAKEWTLDRNPLLLVGGATLSLALFSLYVYGLQLAELSTVTFGWIVGLQVGILVVERVRYGVELPAGKWIAIVGILILQAYLILGPSGPNGEPDDGMTVPSSVPAVSIGT